MGEADSVGVSAALSESGGPVLPPSAARSTPKTGVKEAPRNRIDQSDSEFKSLMRQKEFLVVDEL